MDKILKLLQNLPFETPRSNEKLQELVYTLVTNWFDTQEIIKRATVEQLDSIGISKELAAQIIKQTNEPTKESQTKSWKDGNEIYGKTKKNHDIPSDLPISESTELVHKTTDKKEDFPSKCLQNFLAYQHNQISQKQSLKKIKFILGKINSSLENEQFRILNTDDTDLHNLIFRYNSLSLLFTYLGFQQRNINFIILDSGNIDAERLNDVLQKVIKVYSDLTNENTVEVRPRFNWENLDQNSPDSNNRDPNSELNNQTNETENEGMLNFSKNNKNNESNGMVIEEKNSTSMLVEKYGGEFNGSNDDTYQIKQPDQNSKIEIEKVLKQIKSDFYCVFLPKIEFKSSQINHLTVTILSDVDSDYSTKFRKPHHLREQIKSAKKLKLNSVKHLNQFGLGTSHQLSEKWNEFKLKNHIIFSHIDNTREYLILRQFLDENMYTISIFYNSNSILEISINGGCRFEDIHAQIELNLGLISEEYDLIRATFIGNEKVQGNGLRIFEISVSSNENWILSEI